MIQSYKQRYALNEPYDTIVIGSGLGGLTAAAILAKEGQKLLLYRAGHGDCRHWRRIIFRTAYGGCGHKAEPVKKGV